MATTRSGVIGCRTMWRISVLARLRRERTAVDGRIGRRPRCLTTNFRRKSGGTSVGPDAHARGPVRLRSGRRGRIAEEICRFAPQPPSRDRTGDRARSCRLPGDVRVQRAAHSDARRNDRDRRSSSRCDRSDRWKLRHQCATDRATAPWGSRSATCRTASQLEIDAGGIRFFAKDIELAAGSRLPINVGFVPREALKKEADKGTTLKDPKADAPKVDPTPAPGPAPPPPNPAVWDSSDLKRHSRFT